VSEEDETTGGLRRVQQTCRTVKTRVLTAPREASLVAPSLGRVDKCVFKATAYKLDQVLQPVGGWLRESLHGVCNTFNILVLHSEAPMDEG
jgi:hypothetical protein